MILSAHKIDSLIVKNYFHLNKPLEALNKNYSNVQIQITSSNFRGK